MVQLDKSAFFYFVFLWARPAWLSINIHTNLITIRISTISLYDDRLQVEQNLLVEVQ